MVTPSPINNYLNADNTNPAVDWVAITASATPIAGGPTRGLYCGSGGDFTLLSKNGNSAQFVGVPAGAILPVQAVSMTATTATGVVALF